MTLLNIGSGQRPFPQPWINIDTQERWKPDVVADARDLGHVARPESVDVAVLHHVIEHFHLQDAEAVLRECHRVLKPGGSLIITTPDLHQLVRGWLHQRLDNYLFCVNLYGAYMGDEADTHKWLYTGETLKELLTKAGDWTRIKSYDGRQILGSDIASDWWMLGAEAVK